MEIKDAAFESKHDWNRFVAENYPPVGAFMQSWEWGDFQKDLGREVGRYVIMDDGKRIAAFMLVRYALPFGLAYDYAPRGPVIVKNAPPEKILKIFDAIKDWAREKFPELVFFRLEPPLADMPPGLQDSGFHIPPYYIQPRYNAMVSLDGSEAEIAASFHPSTRSNLHRAEKRGVKAVVKVEVTPADYDAFSLMKKDTIARNSGKNAYPSDRYFQSLFATVPFLAKDNRDENVLSLAAFYGYHEGVPASAHFVLFFGKTATYLYGASHTAHLNSKVDTYLHWQAMIEAKRRGCRYYDLGGIDEQKWPSLTAYKRQFRGKELSYVGNVTLPFRKLLYHAYISLWKIRH
ncbi:MAG: peptidoglycan bridge formation glycyltransferase FemA/FemB family protein [Minisyncoccia bacterium]